VTHGRRSAGNAAATAAAAAAAAASDVPADKAAAAAAALSSLKGLDSSKWPLTALKQYFAQVEGATATRRLFARVNDLLLRTVIACEDEVASLSLRRGVQPDQSFELLGFDVMIDSNLTPWLIEVNIGPSLSASSPLDKRIKTALLRDVFNLVGVPVGGDGSGRNAPPDFAAAAAAATAQANRDAVAIKRLRLAESKGTNFYSAVSTNAPINAGAGAGAGSAGAGSGKRGTWGSAAKSSNTALANAAGAGGAGAGSRAAAAAGGGAGTVAVGAGKAGPRGEVGAVAAAVAALEFTPNDLTLIRQVRVELEAKREQLESILFLNAVNRACCILY